MNCKKTTIALAITAIFATGCGTIYPNGRGDVVISRAQVPHATKTYTDLTTLPAPRGKITAAVYEFRDKTGQYKPQPSNGLSTVVTQGADTILMKALLDSNWFIPVERAGLQNLLTERKITQSANAAKKKTDEIPPVSPAQIILQGTVVSYDSNTHTGGTGARLLGLGASQSYREDRVTVNIRLIDIDDGIVVHSVSSSKRIFSRQLNTGLFSYVDADKILELEAGNSYNEPSHVAITEAIESALIHLVGEGVIKNTWQLADFKEIKNPLFNRFLRTDVVDSYFEKTSATAKLLEERNDLLKKVRVRMERGRSAVKERWESLAEDRKVRERQYARERRKRLNRIKLAAANNNPGAAQNEPIAANSRRSQQSRGQSEQLLVSPNNVVQPLNTDRLVAEQAQAILNAQANIQIKATQQAHQAALYAQKLILQKQAQQRQSQSSQSVTQQPQQATVRQEPVTSTGEQSGAVSGNATSNTQPIQTNVNQPSDSENLIRSETSNVQ